MVARLGKERNVEMPFLDHLEELRWRIIWSLAALVVSFVVGFWVMTQFNVLGLLIRPVQPYLPDGKLIYLSPADPFMITVQLALVIGLLLAFPVIAYQIWTFVSPALTREEKRAIVPALYLGLVLFAVGVTGAYYFVLPPTLRFFTMFQVENLTPFLTAAGYFGLVTKLLLAFGAIFELPVVILVLSALQLVTSAWLRSKRRYAIAGGAVIAALITPGDVVSLTLFMMLPLMLLYEISIMLAWIVERRRRKVQLLEMRAAAESLPEES
jgi:sec-independent protein translocase protein TatC